MKPVIIFRHIPIEGPGYFGTFLDARHIPWQLVRVDEDEPLPVTATAFSGLVFMGGPMSVNDPLPWIPSALALIREAAASDIPVLGHCLGGQLLSAALGGIVSKNVYKEIGWGNVTIANNPVAREWLGDLPGFEAFHWHGETFTLPERASLLFSSLWCENQAFAIGKHLAMQCHVEMTEAYVRVWSDAGAAEIAGNPGPAVQTADAMQASLPERICKLNAVASRLYTHWIEGLKP